MLLRYPVVGGACGVHFAIRLWIGAGPKAKTRRQRQQAVSDDPPVGGSQLILFAL